MRAPDQDLGSQQHKLASVQYDLRITNLAQFLYSKIRNSVLVIPAKAGISHKRSPIRRSAPLEDDSVTPRPTLLDVGAGNGLFLKFFKSHGFTVEGYELEAELVKNMQIDPELKGVMVEQGDITKLKGKAEFDVVIASDVIEHIEDDIKAIKGLYTFVKPGGMLLITVPGHSYLYGKRDVMWGHFRRYDQRVLLGRIDKAISSSVMLSEAKHPEKDMDPSPPLADQDDHTSRLALQGKTYQIIFATQWNIIGFFVYGFFEKILHKPINEKMRYSKSPVSRFTRFVLDRILKFEESMGGVPLGLTQVVGVRKK